MSSNGTGTVHVYLPLVVGIGLFAVPILFLLGERPLDFWDIVYLAVLTAIPIAFVLLSFERMEVNTT